MCPSSSNPTYEDFINQEIRQMPSLVDPTFFDDPTLLSSESAFSVDALNELEWPPSAAALFNDDIPSDLHRNISSESITSVYGGVLPPHATSRECAGAQSTTSRQCCVLTDSVLVSCLARFGLRASSHHAHLNQAVVRGLPCPLDRDIYSLCSPFSKYE